MLGIVQGIDVSKQIKDLEKKYPQPKKHHYGQCLGKKKKEKGHFGCRVLKKKRGGCSERGGKEMRSESLAEATRALQGTRRTLDFIRIAVGGHWRVLTRGVTQFDLWLESLLLLTSFHT